MFSDHVKTPLKRWYFSFKLDLFFPHEQYLKSPDHICFIFQYKSYSPSNTIWNISIYSLLSLVRKWVPWISRKMSWRQVEQGFGMLHFEKSSNLAKNEENPCSTCLQPISLSYCGYLKPVFRVPFPPLWKRAAAILLLSWKYLLFSLISLRV